MLAHVFVRRAGFLVVLIAGVGCAGAGFAADDEAGAWSKKAGVEIPRELAMRPLPTYRIEPPDIIQIEVTCAKAARGGENQPAKKWEEAKPSGGVGTEPVNSTLNVTGSGAPTETKTDGGSAIINGENTFTGNVSGTGTLTLSGAPTDFKSGGSQNVTVASTPAENVAGSTTVSGGTLTLGSASVAGEPLNKSATGTIILRGANNYSGTTATFSAANNYTGTTSVSSDHTYVFTGDNKPGATTVTDGGDMYWQVNANPNVTLALANASPSAEGMKITRTTRGISGAALGAGQYLVGPDGTINMRQYGTVQVTGMTIAEVKAALEKHLSKFMESPEVWVDVLGHNSKVFYVITDGAGSGDNVRRIPITGNETVLDALAAIGGLSQFSSKKIWLSRPSTTNSRKGTILNIDYAAITQRGATETNYQIMPSDRIFIAPDSVIAINTKLGKVTAPVERVMGLIGLGTSTIRGVKKLMGEDKDHQGPDDYDW
jgi:protein involved in polysaccharide export with SLBB domain